VSQAADAGPAAAGEPTAEPIKRLHRSRSNRVFAGVCGGLADYFGLHHGVYRVAFIALAFVGGAGILLYIAAALVIPDEGEQDSVLAHALREHRERPWLVVGVALLGLAALIFLSSPHPFLWNGHHFWFVALVVGIVIVLWQLGARREAWHAEAPPVAPPAPPGGPPSAEGVEPGASTVVAASPPAPRRGRPSLFWPGIGLLFVAGGVLGLLQALDTVDVNWTAALAGGVILVGALMALAGWQGHAAGLAFLGVLLLLAMGVGLSASGAFEGGIGERIEQPHRVADLPGRYRLGIGNLEVDLSRLGVRPGQRTIKANLGIGKLQVTVPPGTALSVHAHTGVGNTDVFGRTRSGTGVSQRFEDKGFETARKRLVLDLRVGIGDLVVRR
jgi:phage shock protein PspC (stress-responsive transcriptional regulator)